MPLDPEFFNAIRLDLIKKKYFDAKTVIALLEDIRMQAQTLNAENRRLRSQSSDLDLRKDQIGDTLLSAKTISQQIIREAEAEAAKILDEARAEREKLLQIGTEREEAARRETGERLERIRGRLLDCAEDISAEWQDLTDGAQTPPADLEQKVGAIAEQLFGKEE